MNHRDWTESHALYASGAVTAWPTRYSYRPRYEGSEQEDAILRYARSSRGGRPGAPGAHGTKEA